MPCHVRSGRFPHTLPGLPSTFARADRPICRRAGSCSLTGDGLARRTVVGTRRSEAVSILFLDSAACSRGENANLQ